MKLAIKKDEGSIPGGGFHYMLHPIRLSDAEAEVWGLMGYHLVEVDDPRGERLLAEANAAIRHQVEVAFLVDGPGNASRAPIARELRSGPTDFAGALDALRAGRKVARSGWNGKGMFVVLQAGYPDGIPINRNTAQATGLAEGTVCRFLPYLMFKTSDGAFVPWLASQTDLLANDWTAA